MLVSRFRFGIETFTSSRPNVLCESLLPYYTVYVMFLWKDVLITQAMCMLYPNVKLKSKATHGNMVLGYCYFSYI